MSIDVIGIPLHDLSLHAAVDDVFLWCTPWEQNSEMRILNPPDIALNNDYSRFASQNPFYPKRAWTDYPGLIAFNSRIVAYLGYHSPLSGMLHKLLYLFREPFYHYDHYGRSLS